jgi:hypothetical protein
MLIAALVAKRRCYTTIASIYGNYFLRSRLYAHQHLPPKAFTDKEPNQEANINLFEFLRRDDESIR